MEIILEHLSFTRREILESAFLLITYAMFWIVPHIRVALSTLRRHGKLRQLARRIGLGYHHRVPPKARRFLKALLELIAPLRYP